MLRNNKTIDCSQMAVWAKNDAARFLPHFSSWCPIIYTVTSKSKGFLSPCTLFVLRRSFRLS